jgi:putative heme-binding domain-containing protein
VSGYSRGKLWRTRLAKTSAGYVAQNQLIACLDHLTADACVSPRGDLIVAVHSGQPDWGSGPKGEGKLYRISYSDKAAPQPVLIWPGGESETCIEFDRPIDPTQLKNLAKSIVVTEGRYAGAGDRFESLRPGYQTVQNQLAQPRNELEIVSVVLAADGRTLVIRTVPRARAVNYAVALPRIAYGDRPAEQGARSLPQHQTIDLAHDLSGVEASWQSTDRKGLWNGWLPHLDTAVGRAFTTGSEMHARLWPLFKKPGQLSLRTQLDLWQMLRAATQPGSKLDFEYPPETVTLVLKSASRLDVKGPATVERVNDGDVRIVVTPQKDKWVGLEAIVTTTPDREPALEVSWFTAEDSRPRALPLRRSLLPWARPPEEGPAVEPERLISEIAGGNWLRGRNLFFGDQASCYKCHTVGGRGGKIGPDLSNLVHRDYASVFKDITQPSAAINPDHIAYNFELKDGESVSGVPAGGEGDELLLADATGRLTPVSRKHIISMKPSAVSLMPEGLLTNLTAAQSKDLLTFLLMSPPLEPATLEIPGEPPPRRRVEVEALLNPVGRSNVAPAKTEKLLTIVLCAGPKDHGPGEHDYPLWQKRWAKLMAMADQVTIETADRWPSAAQLAKADVIVFYSNNPDWNGDRAAETDTYLRRGGGMVFIHYAVDGHAHCDELANHIGLAWRGGESKFRHGPLDLSFQPHAITAGFERMHLVDESYWNLIGSKRTFNCSPAELRKVNRSRCCGFPNRARAEYSSRYPVITRGLSTILFSAC